MSLFDWDDSLSVGIEEIDEQHKRLLALLNDLNEALLHSDAKGGYARARAGALAYAREHLSQEEALMRQTGFPRYDRHKTQHEEFMAHVNILPEHPGRLDREAAEMLLAFLRDWLVEHIMGGDQIFASFYRSRDGGKK